MSDHDDHREHREHREHDRARLTYADHRARLAAAADLADLADETGPDRLPLVTLLGGAAAAALVPDGFSAWRVGPEGGPVVVVPTLTDDANPEFVRRWLARIVATALHRCPLCSEVARLDREPPAPGEQGRAVFHALPLYVRVQHAHGCPADTFTEDERRYLLPPVGTAGTEPEADPPPG